MTSLVNNIPTKTLESFSSLMWRRFSRHRLALISLVILLIMVFLSLSAPWIETFLGVSHTTASLAKANMPATWPHILGSNELGQDVFTRLIYGGRISLSVGFLSALTSAIIGTVIGLLAGYFGGYVDAMLMRFTDAMLSIPVLPLMIVFAALDLNRLFAVPTSLRVVLFSALTVLALVMCMRFIIDAGAKKRQPAYFRHLMLDASLISALFMGGYLFFSYVIPWQSMLEANFASVLKLILIIVFFGWMTVARLARASAMQLKNMEFVVAARALGASHSRIIMAHILPNILAPIIVAASLEVGANILYEAALSFLGLGIQPPVSSWGNMLNNAVDYIKTTPSLAFWPGLFILLTVACFNFLGDGMRDALDPHQLMKSAKGK